jgi:hypothetical protein
VAVLFGVPRGLGVGVTRSLLAELWFGVVVSRGVGVRVGVLVGTVNSKFASGSADATERYNTETSIAPAMGATPQKSSSSTILRSSRLARSVDEARAAIAGLASTPLLGLGEEVLRLCRYERLQVFGRFVLRSFSRPISVCQQPKEHDRRDRGDQRYCQDKDG